MIGFLDDAALFAWLLNFVSFFCSGRGISFSVLGKTFAIVCFNSFLGFGGNGLLGLDGVFICFCSLEVIDSWGLTKVWFGFTGTLKFDCECADWEGGFCLSSDFWFFCVLGRLFLTERISLSNFLVVLLLAFTPLLFFRKSFMWFASRLLI